MFDKKKFAIIIEKIKKEYENQEKFSEASGINRTYLSKYMNMRIDEAPTPSTLYKLASASKGITTYDELLKICGYYEKNKIVPSINSQIHTNKNSVYAIPLFTFINGELVNTESDVWFELTPDGIYSYFAYQTIDESMAPLLNSKDIAIIKKKEQMEIESGRTFLLKYEDKIMIRKIVETNDDNIELFAMNPYYPVIKTTKNKITIIGRVIKAENQSAFK